MHPHLILWPVLLRSVRVSSQSIASLSVKITSPANTITTSQNVISSEYSTLYEQEEVIEQFIYEAHETGLSPEQVRMTTIYHTWILNSRLIKSGRRARNGTPSFPLSIPCTMQILPANSLRRFCHPRHVSGTRRSATVLCPT